MDDERKPLWPWIAALLIGLPVLYVVSFGPACWWFSDRPGYAHRMTPQFYWPIGWACVNSESLHRTFRWYARLHRDPGGNRFVIIVPADPSGWNMDNL